MGGGLWYKKRTKMKSAYISKIQVAYLQWKESVKCNATNKNWKCCAIVGSGCLRAGAWIPLFTNRSVPDSFNRKYVQQIDLRIGLRTYLVTLQCRHTERYGVSIHRRQDSLLNYLFRSKKIIKLRVTDLCEGNPPMAGDIPLQRASDVENVSI